MKALRFKIGMVVKAMNEGERLVQNMREEFGRFERTMEEVYLLKQVAKDLKSFKEMIRLKRND